MHRKIKIILALFLFAATTINAQTNTSTKKEDLVWYTDVMKANEASVASGKPMFAFFTGSDWCGWCKKLESDVFSKPAFIEWANKNVILVELDFPRNKTLSPELAQQNNNLQQTFHVNGYPTIWLFFFHKSEDGLKYDIEALGSLGYPEGAEPGKAEVKFLQNANGFLKKKDSK